MNFSLGRAAVAAIASLLAFLIMTPLASAEGDRVVAPDSPLLLVNAPGNQSVGQGEPPRFTFELTNPLLKQGLIGGAGCSLGGTVFGLAGGIAVPTTYLALDLGRTGNLEVLQAIGVGLIGGSILGCFIGLPAGIVYEGRRQGRDGSVLATIGGMLVGSVVGLIASVIAPPALIVGSAAGGVAGYALSERARYRRKGGQALRFHAAPGREGTTFGISFSF